VLIAAAVPAVLGVVVWLPLNDGAWDGLINSLGSHLGCESSKMGCLGPAILGSVALVAAAVVAAGVLLRLAGIRPAWPVALAGPVIALLLATASEGSFLASALSPPGLGLGLVLAVAYAAAAYLTMPAAQHVGRIAVAAAVLASVLVLHLWKAPQGQSGGSVIQPVPASPQCPTPAAASPQGPGASAPPGSAPALPAGC
jgi:hypothetical protein